MTDNQLTGLASGYTTITPGTYTIQPGENSGEEAGEATFVCPAGGVPCVVTVKVVSDPADAN